MKRIPQQHDMKRQEMMEKCFACYAENGLTGTGTQALAEACGCTKPTCMFILRIWTS